jgi:ketosteroid isomerase-like protein
MKTFPAVAAAALAACASAPARMDAPATLAAAETAFAAHSMRENMRPAFLAHFADEGVTVRQNGWTESNAFLANRLNPPIALDWRPAYVEVAASAEIGLSTGPTKLTPNATPNEPTYGQYVSVWRRSGDGPWKVIVDLGTFNPTPALWDQPLQAVFVQGARGSLDDAALVAAEAAFTKQSEGSGARSAYALLASERLRLYRNGASPALGRSAAATAHGTTDDKLAWTVERSEVARSGDFGYARGRYASAAEPGKVLGYYLRVWRNEDGRWRVALDIMNPAR